jgi:CHAD domain-containing protein
MGYCLHHRETLDVAMRRIAIEQLDGALLELAVEGPGADEAIHAMRKRMKKLRALIRLIRPELGNEVYARENACYRDSAQALASAREAAVAVTTFDSLVKDSVAQVAPQAFAELRLQLAHWHGHAVRQSSGMTRSDVIAELQAARQRAEQWPLSHRGWRTIAPGFRSTYQRGRDAFARVRQDPTTERFHDFRKWAKYHFYQVQILEPIWPGALEQRRGALKDLSELLGDEHDLADLRAVLLEAPLGAGQYAALGPLLVLLDRRREALRDRARAMAIRLYAEKPKAIERRFHTFFRAYSAEIAPEPPPEHPSEAPPAPEPAKVTRSDAQSPHP